MTKIDTDNGNHYGVSSSNASNGGRVDSYTSETTLQTSVFSTAPLQHWSMNFAPSWRPPQSYFFGFSFSCNPRCMLLSCAERKLACNESSDASFDVCNINTFDSFRPPLRLLYLVPLDLVFVFVSPSIIWFSLLSAFVSLSIHVHIYACLSFCHMHFPCFPCLHFQSLHTS